MKTQLAQQEYKETELGQLPKDWKIKRLGDYCKVFSGFAFKSTDFVKEGVLVVKIGNLQNGTVVIDNRTNYFPKNRISRNVSKFILKEGNILIAMTGATTGKVAVVPKEHENSLLNQRVGKFDIFSEELNNSFFRYCSITSEFQERVLGNILKSAQGNVSPKQIENINISFPPLPEQQKIAYVLSTIQDVGEKTENVINSLKELKKSLMKHLFTYGAVSFEDAEEVKLKDTEIGKVPEGWGVVKLGNLIQIKGGKRLPKGHNFSEKKTAYPYIRIVDFKDNNVNLTNLKFLNEEDREKIKRYIINTEDVYISIAGTIGLIGTIPKELNGANLTENAARLIIKNKETLDKRYLVHFLSSEIGKKEIEVRTTKTSQPKLALMRIQQIPTYLPSLPEQQKIASILSVVDEKIEAEENKKKALDELFKSMIHNLMTAKIRVNELELV